MGEYVETEPLEDEEEEPEDDEEEGEEDDGEDIPVDEALAGGMNELCDRIESLEDTINQVSTQTIKALSDLMDAVDENTTEIKNNLSVSGLIGKGKSLVDIAQAFRNMRSTPKPGQNAPN